MKSWSLLPPNKIFGLVNFVFGCNSLNLFIALLPTPSAPIFSMYPNILGTFCTRPIDFLYTLALAIINDLALAASVGFIPNL